MNKAQTREWRVYVTYGGALVEKRRTQAHLVTRDEHGISENVSACGRDLAKSGFALTAPDSAKRCGRCEKKAQS